MSPSLKMRHGIFAVICGVLLTFQNCAQPPESSSNVSSFADRLPIAVDVQLDTIAYMSCSNIKDPVEKRAYFTIRAGAYTPGKSGLQMRQDFRKATEFYSPVDRAKLFAQSSLNGDTRLNLSIRSAANYQAPWVADDLRAGEDVDSFLPPLEAATIAGPVSAAPVGAWLNYFPGPDAKRLTEASLRYYKFEDNMVRTRQKLETSSGTDAAFLVAGFSGSSDELNLNLRAPAGASAPAGGASPIYGRGFLFSFSTPVGYGGNSDRRVISPNTGIREFDLTTYPPRELVNNTWSCPTGNQFMIMRPEDVLAARQNGQEICRTGPDQIRAGTNDAVELQALRRVLRVEDWFVDMSRHCIVPKRTGDYCYGDQLVGRTISYGTSSCTNNATSVCPHFVSICVRPPNTLF